MSKAIVIAVFVKDDLIQQQIDNLLATEHIDEYSIYFYQDNIDKNPKYNTPTYKEKWNNVEDIIRVNLARFKKATFLRSETNLFPFGICKLAIDTAFTENDFCIFMEDDVFLSKNALYWFNYVYNNNMLTWDTYKFCTGESIFYNSGSKIVSDEEKAIIVNKTKENEYYKYYIEIDNFLTSSIFATTRDIWNTEIRVARGSMNGECVLNSLINENKWKSIFPVVPFAKDIGMLHDAGWSVAWHGKAGVREIKNTYVMADEFETPQAYCLLENGSNKKWLQNDSRFLHSR